MQRALIIGGSMAGLFTGHFLRRAGWAVDIFERSAGPLSARGAGIMTHPELREALRVLGAETTRDFGVAITKRTALDRSGEVVAALDFPQVATSWTRVHNLLSEGFPKDRYHSGADLVGIGAEDAGVVAHFADGTRQEADILVGADGFRSTVRRLVFPHVAPAYAGYVAWRGLLPESDLHGAESVERASQFAFCLPPGEQMIGYLVAGRDNDLRPGHRNYNFVWYRPVAAGPDLARLLTDRDGVVHEYSIPPHRMAPAAIAELRRHAAEVLPPWFQMIVQRTAQPFLQPIYDVAVDRMASGRVVLVGDAAFVVRPHVGGGVVKAAGDAEFLAACLGGDPGPAGRDLDRALERFSADRSGVGHKMIAQARRLGSYLKYTYASEAERAAAAVMGAPDAVLRETAVLDFLRAA